MNGWLLVRIAGIVVGIATLLRVATTQGLVTYDPLFLEWMDWLSDIVELGFLTKLIGPFLHWGIDYVRGLGITVPDLQDEWRPAFVLSALMFGSVARHDQRGWLLVVAPVGALSIAVWSGLIGSLAVVAVATVGVIAFAPAAAVFLVVFFALAASYDYAALLAFRYTLEVNAALAVALAAALLMLAGIAEGWAAGWRSVFAHANFKTGIDILFTMSSALIIATLFANPPIW